MKLFKSTWLIGSMAAGMLALGAPAAVAGIAGSQHDFSAGGNAQGAVAAGTGNPVEICAFCHTPHASDINAFYGAPLWNKSYLGGANDVGGAYDSDGGASTRYSALGTSSLDGAEVAVGSVSLACLSCHDGSQAMDVVLNMPGQGMGDKANNAEGDNINHYDPNGSITEMSSDAAVAINTVAKLGTDLRNDHPVSIEYAGGSSDPWPTVGANEVKKWCESAGQCNDPDFKAVTGINKNGSAVWFFDDPNDINNRVDKDEIRLYTRSSEAGKDAYVECGSCHDPHNTQDQYGNYVADASGNVNLETANGEAGRQVDFLRQSNAGSAICLACHNK